MTGGDTVITTEAEADTANEGDFKDIAYVPYGGTEMKFRIKYVPVAEIYVDFPQKDEEYLHADTVKLTIADNATPIFSKDFTATSNTIGKFGTQTASDSPYKGIMYKLGTTKFTLGAAVIMMDYLAPINTDGTSGSGSFAYFHKTKGPVLVADITDNDADLFQTGDYTFTSVAVTTGTPVPANPIKSREYHINVYRNIATQLKDARDLIIAQKDVPGAAGVWAGKDDDDAATKINNAEGQSMKPTATASDYTSTIVYAGAVPTFTNTTDAVRNDYDPIEDTGYNFTNVGDKAIGWSYIATDAAASGISTVKLAFNPKGGIPITISAASDAAGAGAYRIKYLPALLYKVNFQKYPISNLYAEGTITVGGSVFGDTTAAPTDTINSADTSKKNDDGSFGPYFVGAGTAITVTPTGTPVNVVKYRANAGDAALVGGTSAATTPFALAIPVMGTAKSLVDPIMIDVYPSIAQQQDDFIDNLRLVNTRQRFLEWTNIQGGTKLAADRAIGDPVPADPITGNNTTFRVVAKLSSTAGTTGELQIVTPGNNYYYGVVPQGSDTVAATLLKVPGYAPLDIDNTNNATAVANGNKTVVIKFTPNGTVTSADDKTFTFNLTAIARYDFVKMTGPTGSRNYNINLSVQTYREGTDGKTDPTVLPIEYTQNPNIAQTYYGGIGSFAKPGDATDTVNGPTQIFSSTGNVFSLSKDGATFSDPSTASILLGGANGTESMVYTILVYPRVSEQVSQIKTKLDSLVPTNTTTLASTWTTPPASTFTLLGPLVTPNNGIGPIQPGAGYFANGGTSTTAGGLTAGLGILEVKFTGTTRNTGGGGSNYIDFDADHLISTGAVPAGYPAYSYDLDVSGTASDTAEAIFQVKFTPMNDADDTPLLVYYVKTVPMAKYSVTYMNGAAATVTVSNTAGTTSYFKVNQPSVAGQVQEGYVALGGEKISISASPRAYYNAQLREGTNMPIIDVRALDAGGSQDLFSSGTTLYRPANSNINVRIVVIQNQN